MTKTRIGLRGALSLLGVLAGAPGVVSQMRLEGLDRLYFERVGAPGETLRAGAEVAKLLPEHLPAPHQPITAAAADPDDESPSTLGVEDLELSLPGRQERLWIREVIDASHPRIFEIWWALYDAGRRSDVWYFTAIPNRTDGKLLTNYRLDGVASATRDRLVVRVFGEMFRPAGAWWVVGKELSFAVDERALRRATVRDVFGFFQSYDTGEARGSLGVMTEREADGGWVSRKVDPVSQKLAAACEFRDPADGGELEWAALEPVALCITRGPEAVVKRRERTAPSFIEKASAAAPP